MLVELSIDPLGRGTHLSQDLPEILKIIDDSNLRYCLTRLAPASKANGMKSWRW